MKDEIKEMINDFNEYSTDYTKTRCRELEQVLIDTLDYITNLQEEKDKYKNVIDKIKEKLNVLNEEPYNATTYIMVITEIYKLLEEVE